MDRSLWLKIVDMASKADATAHREYGGKHLRVVLTKGGRSRFVTMSLTPSDYRVTLNRLRDVRQALQHLEGTQ
jgi:hypothetical protein